MHLRFSGTKSAFDYMLTTREYLNEHGKPIRSTAISIRFSSESGKQKQVCQTQYFQVLKELGIELIYALKVVWSE